MSRLPLAVDSQNSNRSNGEPTSVEPSGPLTSSKIVKLIRNPTRYLPLVLRGTLQPLCHVFKKSAFFMQGQMDISPRARWHNSDFTSATGGFYPPNNDARRHIYDLSAHDNTRRDMLALLLRTIIVQNIPGRFAELGVYKGHTAKLIHHYAPERKLHLFDTFSGFTERSVARENRSTGITVKAKEFADTSLAGVRSYLQPRNDNVEYHAGFFPESIPPELEHEGFAFVHLDADLYEPTLEGLKFFYPRTASGGMLVVHDYNSWFGARKAVDDFLADKIEFPLPMPDKSGSALILKR